MDPPVTKRLLLLLAALLGPTAPALAQTKALPPGEIRANGDITFGIALKLGKREGNRTVIMPDTLQILGSGSTGDISSMTVRPTGDDTTQTISDLMSSRLTKRGNDLTSVPEYSIADKVPYANSGSKHFLMSKRTAPAPALLGTTAIIRQTVGSGTFGPGEADFAAMIAGIKDNYATATGADAKEGEIDTLLAVAKQGKKGDTGAIILDASKRRDQLQAVAPDETGGALILEGNVELFGADGKAYHRMHPVLGMAESPLGMSEGRGYGAFMETHLGTWFSAYHAGSMPEVPDGVGYDPNTSWMYYFTGSKSRDPSSLNFLIDSAGRTFSGFPSARMSWGFDATKNAVTFLDTNGNTERASISRDGGGLVLTGRYTGINLVDPVTGQAGGGSHRLVMGGSGELFYQVIGGATSWSVKPNGSFNVPNLVASVATATTSLELPAYTVATMPACNTQSRDWLVVVSDATAPTYRGALTSGGTVRTPAYCDGANWTAH